MWRDLTYTNAGNVGVGGKATSFKATDCLGARVIAEVMVARERNPAVFAVLSGDVRTHGKNISGLSPGRGQSVLLVEGPDTRRRATREGLL